MIQATKLSRCGLVQFHNTSHDRATAGNESQYFAVTRPTRETARDNLGRFPSNTAFQECHHTASAIFSLGDLVRLTVESPHEGYLYVIDRETYGDGSLGEPMLIFLTARTRDRANRVSAGRLIDIPSWTDRAPYFCYPPNTPTIRVNS
jgi:hypothetical protein